MTVATDGRAVELYRSIRGIPLSQRGKAEAMTRIKVTSLQPKITEPGEIKSRPTVHHFGNVAAVRILAKMSKLPGRSWSSLGKLSSLVREDLGQGRGERVASLGRRWSVFLEKLVRLKPMPALQHGHLQ